MKRLLTMLITACIVTTRVYGQQKFNGSDVNLGNIYRLSDAKSRSISPENFTGEKGKGGMAITGTGKDAAREILDLETRLLQKLGGLLAAASGFALDDNLPILVQLAHPFLQFTERNQVTTNLRDFVFMRFAHVEQK